MHVAKKINTKKGTKGEVKKYSIAHVVKLPKTKFLGYDVTNDIFRQCIFPEQQQKIFDLCCVSNVFFAAIKN